MASFTPAPGTHRAGKSPDIVRYLNLHPGLLPWSVLTGLELGFPWVLVLLPLLLLLPRGRGRLLRVIALAALVFALANPTATAPGGGVVVLADVSHSVGDSALEALEEFGGEWRESATTLYFAGDTGGARDDGSVPRTVLQPASTDLARALQVATAQEADRVLLLSDGAQTAGDALQALPPVPVDSLWLEPQPNARVVSLLAPDRASPGETIEVVAVVETDLPTTATVSLALDDGETLVSEQELPPGRTPVPFEVDIEGDADVRVSASVDVGYEQSRVDDERRTEVTVAEEEPVLVVGDPAAADLLRAQQFEVVEGTPADIVAPLPYSAVILREPAASFTPGQLGELQSFVENGGGLMMTGGPQSFGFGGWYRTPVEEVLPVDTDLRTEVEIPLVALVIVLDQSQSMATGNPSKIALAKEGALGVVEVAYQEDLLGMIVFSDNYEWAFRVRQATERGKREMISAISGLGTSGGTILEPGYRAALDALRETDAALKHVIILSDGNLYDGRDPFGGGTPPDFGQIAARAASEGITTSAIAIGASADFQALERIAIAGGGRYHAALDIATLPRIFTSEALTATRSLLREGPLRPVARPHQLSSFEGELGSIGAYVATAAKPTAETILLGVREEPILAVRRHGLGRTAAFTSDLGAWTGDLASGPELPSLLGSVVRWLQSQPAVYSASVSRDGGEVRLVVDAVEDGEYVNDARLQGRLGGNTVQLEQVAPGRYEGALPTTTEGGPVLVVEGGEVVARAALDSPHAEFETEGGSELLAEIVARSGGEMLVSPEGYSPELTEEGVPLWPYLAGSALAVFLAELLLRRFRPERGLGSERGLA